MNSASLSCALLSAAVLAIPLPARAGEPPVPAPQVEVAPDSNAETKPGKNPVEALIGPVTREQIEADPDWVHSEDIAKPDEGVAKALAGVPPGAEVTVFLGTWCGDSRLQVPRLWKALDAAGGAVPFKVRYIGVDRDKKKPAADITAADIHFVPTLIVTRDGHELGRIVEEPLHGVEGDLLALLTGEAHGVLSASQPASH
jgi:hypothetical protein